MEAGVLVCQSDVMVTKTALMAAMRSRVHVSRYSVSTPQLSNLDTLCLPHTYTKTYARSTPMICKQCKQRNEISFLANPRCGRAVAAIARLQLLLQSCNSCNGPSTPGICKKRNFVSLLALLSNHWCGPGIYTLTLTTFWN
jgi:hypothetical protein